MKKATKVFVIIFMIFNLIISIANINTVAASGITTESGYKSWETSGKTTATINGAEREVKATSTQNSVAASSSQLADIAMLVPNVVSKIMTMTVRPNYFEEQLEQGFKNFVAETLYPQNSLAYKIYRSLKEGKHDFNDRIAIIYSKFTIQNLISGYYDIFNIDFFNNTNEVSEEGGKQTINTILKYNVAKYYYVMRSIALIIGALSLVYIGIRMALSTLAGEKAKYKKLLRSWFIGFILIFLMNYIIIFMIDISNVIQEVIVKLANELDLSSDFEYNIVNRVETNYTHAKGFSGVTSVIIYWMMIYYQTKFFIMYLFRVLEVALLIIISPLITITYSIDKASDGRSQAFNAWIKELGSKIFIQNLHTLAYFIFIFSAGNIALKSPLLAILFLSALTRIEKIVTNVLKIQGKGMRDIKIPFFNK